MSLSDGLAIGSLSASVVTAAAATYLSLLALRFTARPRFAVDLVEPRTCQAGGEYAFRFRVCNVGYWFGAPAATSITVWPNFNPQFKLVRARYGSAQEIENTVVRPGKRGLYFVKARHIKLFSQSASEDFFVDARAPDTAGVYMVEIDAVSAEGASSHSIASITVIAALQTTDPSHLPEL